MNGMFRRLFSNIKEFTPIKTKVANGVVIGKTAEDTTIMLCSSTDMLIQSFPVKQENDIKYIEVFGAIFTAKKENKPKGLIAEITLKEDTLSISNIRFTPHINKCNDLIINGGKIDEDLYSPPNEYLLKELEKNMQEYIIFLGANMEAVKLLKGMVEKKIRSDSSDWIRKLYRIIIQ